MPFLDRQGKSVQSSLIPDFSRIFWVSLSQKLCHRVLEALARAIRRLKDMKDIQVGKKNSQYLYLLMIWFCT